MKINPNEISIISKYIASISGIMLGESKAYLVETRLGPLAEELGCSSFTEFFDKIKKEDTSKALQRKVIDAITTNETLFFRDKAPFELLQHKIIPDLIDKRSPRYASSNSKVPIRIWSVACSTGQEVYSIAIVLKELLPDMSRYNIRLLGTDISNAAITEASYGQYSRLQIERGLSEEYLKKYFVPNKSGWKIKDEIRGMALFKKINLLEPFGPELFDIVLCRNVSIYFAPADRARLFDKIANIMAPDGYLIIGASEFLTGVCSRFESKRYLRSVFYQIQH
ncbi:MAG: protein-glutamate O-methyltransferase CheR [Pseudomonadota bacterium]